MGYTLKIGEAVISYSADNVAIDCNIIENTNAPAYGEPTDRQNQRWPSYTSWHNAMRQLDMLKVMIVAEKTTVK